MSDELISELTSSSYIDIFKKMLSLICNEMKKLYTSYDTGIKHNLDNEFILNFNYFEYLNIFIQSFIITNKKETKEESQLNGIFENISEFNIQFLIENIDVILI